MQDTGWPGFVNQAAEFEKFKDFAWSSACHWLYLLALFGTGAEGIEVIRHFRRLTALSGTIFLPSPRVFAGMTHLCVSNSCRDPE